MYVLRQLRATNLNVFYQNMVCTFSILLYIKYFDVLLRVDLLLRGFVFVFVSISVCDSDLVVPVVYVFGDVFVLFCFAIFLV